MIVAPSQRELPSIIRRNISASFSTPQNFVDFHQNINHNLLKTDIISEEPRNFEELMLKSLGLEWNVDETDELEIDENSAHSQSEEQQRRKSRRNRKRETKQKVDANRRNVTGDETKVKDGADKDDRSQPGNRDGVNLAEGLGRTKMKEGGNIEKGESGSKNLKEQLFSSLLNLKESVAELQEGISKEVVENKNFQEVERMEGKMSKNKMGEKDREMDYGLWKPFYNDNVKVGAEYTCFSLWFITRCTMC